MTYGLLFCQIILAIVLWLAATGKITQSDQFLAALRLSRLPDLLVLPITLLIPMGESNRVMGRDWLLVHTEYLCWRSWLVLSML
jgi:sulfite exporter TauE/SafE